MKPNTIFSFDTEFTADSVECCPFPSFTHLTAVGTYQLVDGQTQSRTGRLYLFSTIIDRESEDEKVIVNQVAQVDCFAILDMKWC
jgi:hypothetical protein